MEHTSQEIFSLLEQNEKLSKTPNEFNKLIELLFSNPQTLVQKITQLNNKTLKDRNKEFNIEAIQKIYKNTEKIGLGKQIAKNYVKIASKFEQQNKLSEFIKSKKQMAFFFIVILWEELFTNQQNRLLLYKMLNLIKACPGYATHMVSWAKQLNQYYLTTIMDRLQEYLQSDCQKLPKQSGQVSQILKKNLWLNIKNIANFIGILYNSNKQVKRVPKDLFIFNDLAKYFDAFEQYKLHYKKVTELNILDFPYLMNLDYKYELIRIQSVLEQKMNIQKSMSTGISGMINSMISNENFSLEGLLYLYFEVNRNNILDDSMQKLGKVKQNLKSPLRISFVGEQGADEGGVKNEYFQLITKQIFNPYLDMFLPKHNGRVYWFNGFSFQPPIRFQFVGILLGLSIYNSVHLNIPLPMVLFKKLLNINEQDQFSLQMLDDLFDIEPEIHSGLKKILEEQGPLEDLELYFNVELQSFGEKTVEELVDDGHSIQVTQDNKVYYCQLLADYYLNKHIQKQFDSFKKGFKKVVTGKMIELFDPEDLKTIIYGNDIIDFKQLQQSTVYEGGYSSQSPIVRQLWESLHSLEIQQKKAFLIFATGSDRVPIEGMKSLNFIIQKHSNPNNLPTAHTCFNVFLLPEYESKEKLDKMISLILKNNQGFGLI